MTIVASARPSTPHPGRSRGDRTRRLAQVLGELMLTAGVVLLLFVTWQLFGTGLTTARSQDSLRQQLTQQWAHTGTSSGSGSTGSGSVSGPGSPASRPAGAGVSIPPEIAPKDGKPLAELTIPRLSGSWIVVQGVSLDDLALGPGHYPGTAMPGQVGNFAVAGHRATHDQPFAYLDQVRVGDRLIVKTATRTFVYRVTRTFLTVPTAVTVLDPVPGHPGVTATQRRITLTTCNPRWGHTGRLIVYGLLEQVSVRSPKAGS